ncbi:unnamed protein product [Candidula unifasciata]|uniref:Uncharacterized protein n=1 Tax=Candidula unifasciata TaxID=100452 RepID=A0A8S3ZRU4_9EUPU|nr:unnamed protein product [Candidula unifasciata]
MSACEHGHKLLVQMLVGRGADVNCRDTKRNTPLLISVQNHFTDIVQFLLQNKADVNDCNSQGNTALMHAIQNGSVRNVSFLLQFVKDREELLNVQNDEGLTALMLAVYTWSRIAQPQVLLATGPTPFRPSSPPAPPH